MALKVILLRKKVDQKNKLLEELRSKNSKFVEREKELETAIEEITDETSEEDRNTIEGEVEDLSKEKEANEEDIKKLEKEIEDMEVEIKNEEEKAPIQIAKEERKGVEQMKTRTKFYGMDLQERTAFFENDEVKNLIKEIRTCISEKRALTNAGLIIPQNTLPLITQIIEETSKLMKHVNLAVLHGTGRQNIMGNIPEAIWTEMCATINELSLGFNNTEVDGYKVGGFFAECNAILEDNDVDLVSKFIETIGKAIGKAIDKAIAYGKGTKMPLGVVTRLAQVEKPSDYPITAREWKDLSKTNILKISASGIEIFKKIAAALKSISNDYSSDGLVWIMNKNTALDLKIEAMGTNVSAAIVSTLDKTMPVVGGVIEELSFMKDGDIIFGYFPLYLLAQRKEVILSQSEHLRFLEDQTIFKGTARFDGKPVIDEAFGIINIKNAAPTTVVDFPQDLANKPQVEATSSK